ncbi:MAG: parvulin-like peptidyl-prolyl isomerase [Myxococcota bacterium]|jgi:parvulin-like peptidyl-prolyl isomerase
MKRKTKLTIILIILSIAIASIIAFVVVSNQKNDSVVAKVNGKKIYQSEFDKKLTSMFQNQGIKKTSINDFPTQVIEALAQDIYVQKQLDLDAKKSPVANSKEIKNKILIYKKELNRQAYLEYLTAEQINDQMIKDRYEEISNDVSGKKEVHIKHILLASKNEADKALSSIKKKKSSFEKVAKKISLDKSSASSGGDLGYVIPDKLDKGFADKVLELKRGQISKPIKTKFGWHIVKVEDIRDVDLPEFEETKDAIEENLKQEILEGVFGKIVKDVKVEIFIKSKNSSGEKTTNSDDDSKIEINDEAKK